MRYQQTATKLENCPRNSRVLCASPKLVFSLFIDRLVADSSSHSWSRCDSGRSRSVGDELTPQRDGHDPPTLTPSSGSITLVGPPLPARSSLAAQASCPCRTTSREVVQPALCLRFRRPGRQREQRLQQNP